MAVKIEAGKSYKTRDGQKVGPIAKNHHRHQDPEWEWSCEEFSRTASWRSDGSQNPTIRSDPLDLISEWPSEGPVRTVTRKEIVPGVYGRVKVMPENYPTQNASNGIGIVLLQRDEITPTQSAALDAAELRAAAAVLIELAGALEE